MDEPEYSIAGRKPGDESLAMLDHTMLKVAGDPGVEAARAAGQNVNTVGVAHLCSKEKRIPHFVRNDRIAGMTIVEARTVLWVEDAMTRLGLRFVVIPNPFAWFWRTA